jgi:hypothetical protein
MRERRSWERDAEAEAEPPPSLAGGDWGRGSRSWRGLLPQPPPATGGENSTNSTKPTSSTYSTNPTNATKPTHRTNPTNSTCP